jgi:hypothetical protein
MANLAGDSKRAVLPVMMTVMIADNGKDILDATFLPLRRRFIYPITSTAETAAFGQRLILMDHGLHDQEIGVWCALSRNRVICRILFDDTVKSEQYYEVISLPLHWTFK